MTYADYEYTALRRRVEKLERLVTLLLEEIGLECEEKPGPNISPVIEDLVHKGEMIEAIRLYREETGAGLKEAREFVESLKP
jgi:ribosomal protein L7/L12